MNELGFTEKFLKWHMGDFAWKLFQKWMRGQTISQVNGDDTYYFCDVRRFCEQEIGRYPNENDIERFEQLFE